MPVGSVNKKKAIAKIEAEKAAELAAEAARAARKTTFFEFADGKNRIRILPPPPGSDEVWYRTATHWNVGPDSLRFNCPRAQNEKAECFLCETVSALYETKNERDAALAGKIRAKKKWLYNVYDCNDVAAGLQIAAVGATVHSDIRGYIEDSDGEFPDITDLDEGFNINVTRTGKELHTTYKTVASRNPTPVAPEIAAILETENPADLSLSRPIQSNAAQRAAYLGVLEIEGEEAPPEDDDEDEVEAAAPAVARKPAAAAKPVVVDDDDEEEDDDEDEDDEEEVAPKVGRVGSALQARRAGR